MAVEQAEPDPAGCAFAEDSVVHAYDIEAGELAHSITRRSYVVRPDMPWIGPTPRERCDRCVEIVPRRS